LLPGADVLKLSRQKIYQRPACHCRLFKWRLPEHHAGLPVEQAAGSSSYGEVVAVAGQGIICLRRQFNNIISRKRRVPRSMLRRVRDLPKEYIEALLDFYALQGDRQQQT
jgi:hypothetical protein